jgi:hypothetical protein
MKKIKNDVQSLIFGNSLKNENENRSVFETVSKYIARTKRFERDDL